MFKILKLFVPKTNVSKLMPSRYVCNQKDSCPQKMTSYDCKQPVEESFCGGNLKISIVIFKKF